MSAAQQEQDLNETELAISEAPSESMYGATSETPLQSMEGRIPDRTSEQTSATPARRRGPRTSVACTNCRSRKRKCRPSETGTGACATCSKTGYARSCFFARPQTSFMSYGAPSAQDEPTRNAAAYVLESASHYRTGGFIGQQGQSQWSDGAGYDDPSAQLSGQPGDMSTLPPLLQSQPFTYGPAAVYAESDVPTDRPAYHQADPPQNNPGSGF